MHSYCLFLCWRASEITRHHEPVYLCLHRAADAVSVSGAHRPFAWKVAAKGVVQVWKSLAWKINKLKLALSSASCTLGSCTSVISINQCDNLKPVLFMRSGQKVRTRMEPSQVPAHREAGSGHPAWGSQPLLMLLEGETPQNKLLVSRMHWICYSQVCDPGCNGTSVPSSRSET